MLLRITKFFYPVAIHYWSVWSKVYRFIHQRKYNLVPLKTHLTPSEANETVNVLRWSGDGPWALWDACGTPQWVQHAINEVSKGSRQPKGYLDCDDFSIWCAHVIDKRYYPVVFTFSWLDRSGKLRGHAMCLTRQKDGRVCHVGNWGIYGPYAGLRDACDEIMKLVGAEAAVGWALLDLNLTVLCCGRGLPGEEAI
jgi:hypothetical protein